MFDFFTKTLDAHNRIEFPRDSNIWKAINHAVKVRDTRARAANISDQQLFAVFRYIDALEARIAKLEGQPTPNPAPGIEHAPDTGTFGSALHCLGQGKRVARAGWVQWNTYIWLMPPAAVPREHIKEAHLKELCGNKESIEVHGCLRMLTYEGKVLTGWTPNQADMQATDWVVVE